MTNKKVAIVTLYDSINCGTFLQAYALGEYLKKIGFEPLYLELKNDNSHIEKNKTRKDLTFSNIIIKLIRKVLLKRKFKHISKQFNTITLSELNNDNNIKNVIIGSDEIWNINNKSFTHYKEYYGYNFKNKKIIAYAPSCNDLTSDELLAYDKNINFNNFYALSSRDEKTYKLLSFYTDQKITRVLDPTFLLDSYEDKLCEINIKDYILVYGHDFNNYQVEIIKQIAHTKHKKIISITKYFEWCDKNIISSPFEFISYIKNADYIITSTFHGSIFSILQNKNFVVFAEQEGKVTDLLKKFELSNRIIKSYNEGIKALDSNIDYEKVENLISKYKKISQKYLIDNLGDQSEK